MPPCIFGLLPLDHAGIVLFPALLEQALLGEVGSSTMMAIPVAFGLEHVRHHRDTLVGTGRTTIGIGWGDHHDDPAVLNRVELSLEQLGLLRLPGGTICAAASE